MRRAVRDDAIGTTRPTDGLTAGAGAKVAGCRRSRRTFRHAERDPAREFLALAEGRADLAMGSALQWSARMPPLAVFALPWLAPDPRDRGRARATGRVAGDAAVTTPACPVYRRLPRAASARA
jgi:hypothetical protein